MSGIYIPGMEMPKDRSRWIVIYPDGKVDFSDRNDEWETLEKSAVSVPPHGRPIDADAFANEVINSFMDCAGLFEDANSLAKAAEIVDAFVADINEAPTIIQAEEEAETLIGTDMHGGIKRDESGNVIDWGITGPPGDPGVRREPSE